MEAEEVVSLRKAKGWSQQELADWLGVHRMTVSRWDRGASPPTGAALKALERLAQRAEKGRQP